MANGSVSMVRCDNGEEESGEGRDEERCVAA